MKNPAIAGFFMKQGAFDMADIKMEAAIFFEPYLPNALRQALANAVQGGLGTEDDDDDLHGYDAEYGMGGDATLGAWPVTSPWRHAMHQRVCIIWISNSDN